MGNLADYKMETGLNAETAGLIAVIVALIRLVELIIGKFVYKDRTDDLHAHMRKIHDDVKELKILMRYGYRGDNHD